MQMKIYSYRCFSLSERAHLGPAEVLATGSITTAWVARDAAWHRHRTFDIGYSPCRH